MRITRNAPPKEDYMVRITKMIESEAMDLKAKIKGQSILPHEKDILIGKVIDILNK
jgi:hypothetical protein